ncbi:DUF4136 domain-containing protein [Sphingomonas pruni]|uniref:DUF4136 domain-containing protein n=1 Tax=Sphingomonas pruni TaxID=40683 RepID=UPI0009FD6D56|nr:DUF4136 domain-containing protein [Sphingomonas pruni]
MRRAILLTAALMVTGCATAPASFPTEVTRYRADEVGRGTIALMPDEGIDNGPEYQVYALAVGDALTKQGYTLVPDGSKSVYVAMIGFHTEARPVRERSPFSIGLGGGTWSGNRDGGGVGLGGGVSFPIGRGRDREDALSMLSVKINQRQGDLGVWEGRAQSRAIGVVGNAVADKLAPKLATALFTGFPGESGRTIEVK